MGDLRMVAGSYYIPKTNELRPLGEDAHFISSESQTIGIADGVGGWSVFGIDSGEYSRQLMTNARRFSKSRCGRIVDPVKVLNKAVSKTKQKGSSTACIFTLKDVHLHAVNVGDSGFVHIRGEKIVYRSPIQEKDFNCPYQLAWSDKNDLKFAQKIKRVLLPGDVIVAGTDGLFDNVQEEEIEKLVKKGLLENSISIPEIMAGNIALFALQKAKDHRALTPFTERRRMAGIKDAAGGKYDDITVVVAHILPPQLKNKKKSYGINNIHWGIGKFWWRAMITKLLGKATINHPLLMPVS